MAFAVLSIVVAGRTFAAEDAPLPAAAAVIRGRIVGPDQNPLPGVQIQLRAGAKTLDQTDVTGPDGTFRVEGVPAPGVYRVVCSVGSVVEKGPEVTLTRGGEVATADVTLRLRMSEQVSVTAEAWTLPMDVPNSVAIKTAEKLAEQNLFNPEDALRYAPSTVIRKRYIGDRNALLGGRSFGTLQPSRGLVFLDGYLLSNFLGRFDAPRWNMVTPEALERVDVLYGPFSAIHAGNSIGTTVVTTERTPVRLRIDVPAQLPAIDLTSEVRHNLFLAAKEALHNALEHSGASEVWLRLSADGGRLVIEVADDGRGFVPGDQPGGNGVGNMRHRLADCGGTCEISSAPNRGTRVRFSIPLPTT